ncbi:MAG TPA: metal-dependent hydrolase [Thermoguttaceae bacterium]|nr:metal-dependent hydrolase [Thermoguttaceae bacterium]
MTFFEHAMIGVDGALALGLYRRWGWPIVALAAVESMLPDWDGMTLCLGPSGYIQGHRVWGHGLLVAGLVAVVTSALLWRGDLIPRVQRALGRRWTVFAAKDSTDAIERSCSWRDCLVWMVVGLVAAWGHLLADVLFSIGRHLPIWGVPLWWPFSRREFAWPMIAWGDVGPTIILAAGMFAMVRRPRSVQLIAAATLGLLAVYVGVRGWFL